MEKTTKFALGICLLGLLFCGIAQSIPIPASPKATCIAVNNCL
jgi:hypothetical protein